MINKVSVFQDVMDNFNEFKEYVKTLSITKPSPVFSISTGIEDVIKETRNSRTLIVYDPAVLELVNKVILDRFKTCQSLTEDDLVVKLARNHVTFIRYDEGGFFDWHIDHEKYRINNGQKWLECHLLLCLDAPESGGELEIKTPEVTSFLMIENQAIVFDKNMEHRGSMVTKGTKIIMTIDVMVSNQITVDTEGIGLKSMDCLLNNQTFMSSHVTNVSNALKDYKVIMFDYIYLKNNASIQGRPDTIELVYDCKGLYYKKHNGKEWYRTDESESESFDIWNSVNLIASDLQEVVEAQVGDEVVKFSKVNKSIPMGTKWDTASIIRTDTVNIPTKIEYTYYCNEVSYDTIDITRCVGVLQSC